MTSVDNKRGGFSRWLVRGLSRILVLVLVFVAGAVVMHVGMHGGDREHAQMLQSQNTELLAQLKQSQADAAAARSASGVDQGTRQALQGELAALQQKLGHAQDQLAFYEQLIPAGPAGSVTIRAFEVRQDGGFLHYRVLLTRSAPESSAPFNGRLRFVATGQQDGKAATTDLVPPQSETGGASAAPDAAAGPLDLSLEQFQRSTGVLQMIPGLTIQSVRVDVLEGDTVRASRDVALDHAAPDTAGAAQ